MLRKKMTWECVGSFFAPDDINEYELMRASVPGGWLIATFYQGDYDQCAKFKAMTYVPDPEHIWK